MNFKKYCYNKLSHSRNALALVVALFLLVRVSPASAQQIKLSVIPPQVQIIMKPGISLIKAFNFENQKDPGIFYFQIVSFRSSGDQGNIELGREAEGPMRFSLENSDVRLGEKFFLKSRSLKQAVLKIRAIENAPLGDYYYTLLMISEPPSAQASTGRGSAMIGANILISITRDGFTPTSVKIAQFTIVPRYKFSLFGKQFLVVEPTDEVPVILKLANTGSYLIAPDVKLNLRGGNGVTRSRKLLPQNILRNSERVLMTKELEKCSYCRTATSAVFEGYHFGKYFLSADISFTGLNQKIFAQTEFWALPVRLTKTVMALFFLMSLLLYILSRKRHHE